MNKARNKYYAFLFTTIISNIHFISFYFKYNLQQNTFTAIMLLKLFVKIVNTTENASMLPFQGISVSTSASGDLYKTRVEGSPCITIGKQSNKYKHLGASLYTRRSFWKPTKTMASSLFVLLSLALVAIAVSSPVPAESPSVEIIVVEERPGLPLVEAATGSEGEDHRIAKRSALRGDNPSNDLLADLEGLKYDNGLTGLEGRRIKFLPTWLG